MRVPVSWLAEYVDLPPGTTLRELAAALTRAGLEVETATDVGQDVTGIVVGEVLEIVDLAEFKKPIRHCQVSVRPGEPPRGIVCGARNFAVGDRVVVALPGAVLAGGFEIGARRTYGHLSDGMICSARELGAGDDQQGILVLPSDAEIGADAAELLGLRDSVLDIAVTPDRGYCLSIRGIARETAAAFGVAFHDPAAVAEPAEPASGSAGSAAQLGTIDDPTAADRLVLRSVRGIDPAVPSPLWMQRRLQLAGMRPISLAVDVTNYVMHELGQPLHAFDAGRLTGSVVVRRAQPGERLTTLDHVDRALHPEDVLIADDSGGLSLAGTMGGLSSEVAPETTDLVIEAAHFAPVGVARMSRRHELGSEASRRFERGVDPALPPAASARAVELLVSIGGGRYAGSSDVSLTAQPAPVVLPVDLPGRVVGVTYDRDTVVAHLTTVGCDVQGDGDELSVTPPSWRPDLVDPYDLVEEVVRLDGYDKVPSVLPRTPAARGLTAAQLRRRAVSRALAAAGYVEALSYPFQNADALDIFGVAADDERRRLARLANPLSEAAPFLRTTMLPPLLETLRRNLGRGNSDVALYEIGPVFRDPPGHPTAPRPSVAGRPGPAELAALDAALPEQPVHVGLVLTGARELPGAWGPGRAATWADAVDAARTVAEAAGVLLTVEQGQRPPWHPGRCAALSVAGRLIGYAGELHPRVTGALDLPPRTAALELDFSALLVDLPGALAAPLVSAFPPANQDVSLVVHATVPAAMVESALRDGAGELLESVRLFDVYAGAQLRPGQRSLAYALRFRAPDRTLTVEEATTARDAAVAEATRRTGAVLRS